MSPVGSSRPSTDRHRVVGLVMCFAAACACAPAPPAQSQTPQSSERSQLRDSLHTILARAFSDSAFPGAFAVVGTHAGILAEDSVGHLDWGASAVPNEHSLWDLASLTKVVGMTTAMIQLYEQGKVSIDPPLQRYIPEWQVPHS